MEIKRKRCQKKPPIILQAYWRKDLRCILNKRLGGKLENIRQRRAHETA